jgi:hypothetical protein
MILLSAGRGRPAGLAVTGRKALVPHPPTDEAWGLKGEP